MNKDEMEESESCKGLNVQVKDFNFIGFSFRPNRPWKKLRHRAVNDLLKVRVGTVEPSDLWPHSYGKLLPEKLISPTVEMDPRAPRGIGISLRPILAPLVSSQCLIHC